MLQRNDKIDHIIVSMYPKEGFSLAEEKVTRTSMLEIFCQGSAERMQDLEIKI